MPPPSRIIFHYFHDTLFKLFSIPALFSRFFFVYPSSRVFLLFPSRLFRASTFSSYSTTLSPTGFPYPFFLLSRPYLTLFIIFRIPPTPPSLRFTNFDFSHDPFPKYLASSNLIILDRSCRFQILISSFRIYRISINLAVNFQFQFFKFFKFHSETFRSRDPFLLDGCKNDRKLFHELSPSLSFVLTNTVRNTRMMGRRRPIRARCVTRAHTNTERGGAFNLAHLVPGLDTSRVVTRRGRKEGRGLG